MHHRLELIMPPTDDIASAVEQILAPWNENLPLDDEDNYRAKFAFFDWYQIGGRYSGKKLIDAIPEEQMKRFYDELNRMKITVSCVTAGKQTLQPESQVELVNATWRSMFPDHPIQECPLFDNYVGADGDVMKLADLPAGAKARRVIIARKTDDGLEASLMVSGDFWNGVTWLDTAWDITIRSALEMNAKMIENFRPEIAAKRTPGPDWLVVTVDCHS